MTPLRTPLRLARSFPLWAALLATSLAVGSAPAASFLPEAVTTADGTWSSFSAGPNPQESSAGVYDTAHGRMVMFGGWNGAALNTTWSLTLGPTPRWTLLPIGGATPPARYAASMIYLPGRDLVLLFGGSNDGNALTRFNDVWAMNLSGTPVWTKITTAGTPPSGRIGHMAIYDPVGDRMIVFGGYDGAFEQDVWQLSLSGTPTWGQVAAGGPLPLPRDFGTAIYDPGANRMLVFGGNTVVGANPATAANDVWALALGAAPAWSQVATAGTPPSPRLLHASFYDPSRTRMVTMGGTNATNWFNDTYALSLGGGTPTWSAVSPVGVLPATRSDHLFVYDPAGDRGIVFGGRHPDPFFNDVWTLAFAGTPAWSQVQVGQAGGPRARLLHKAVYDSSRNSYITFGGTDAVEWFDDTWSLSLDASLAWTSLANLSTRPPARSDHVLVRDPSRDRLILFGGRDLNGFFGDVWAFNEVTGTWSQLAPSGAGPGAREAMVGMYDALRDRVLIMGGWDGTKALNDVWELDFTPTLQWKAVKLTGKGPAPRYAHALVYDAPRDRAIITGGFDGQTLFGDTWSLDLGKKTAWRQLATQGVGPGNRDGEDAVFDSARNRMLVFGGYTGSFQGDDYALDLAASKPAWTKLNPAGVPPSPRDFSWSIYDPTKDRVVQFGGNAELTPGGPVRAVADLWILDFGGAAAALPTGDPMGYGSGDPASTDVTFGFAGALPNPVVGQLRVEFRLPASGGGSLDLLDVRGRRVAHEDLSGLAAGTHAVDLGLAGRVAPGVYFVQLVQGARSSQRKVVVLR